VNVRPLAGRRPNVAGRPPRTWRERPRAARAFVLHEGRGMADRFQIVTAGPPTLRHASSRTGGQMMFARCVGPPSPGGIGRQGRLLGDVVPVVIPDYLHLSGGAVPESGKLVPRAATTPGLTSPTIKPPTSKACARTSSTAVRHQGILAGLDRSTRPARKKKRGAPGNGQPAVGLGSLVAEGDKDNGARPRGTTKLRA